MLNKLKNLTKMPKILGLLGSNIGRRAYGPYQRHCIENTIPIFLREPIRKVHQHYDAHKDFLGPIMGGLISTVAVGGLLHYASRRPNEIIANGAIKAYNYITGNDLPLNPNNDISSEEQSKPTVNFLQFAQNTVQEMLVGAIGEVGINAYLLNCANGNKEQTYDEDDDNDYSVTGFLASHSMNQDLTPSKKTYQLIKNGRVDPKQLAKIITNQYKKGNENFVEELIKEENNSFSPSNNYESYIEKSLEHLDPNIKSHISKNLLSI